MGYEVHITRRQHWLDEDGPAIGLNEWLKVVHSDPEMHYEGPTKEEALAAGNATNPDEEILRKVWKLAHRLKAKVQGDDGEIYGADGKVMSDAEAIAAGLSIQRKPWWKFW